MTSKFDLANFDRVAKIFLDSGEVQTAEDGLQRLRSFRLNVVVGQQIVTSQTMQAALLTIVNAAARSFLGGVSVSLPGKTVALLVPFAEALDLSSAIVFLGGQLCEVGDDVPTLLLGDTTKLSISTVQLRVTFDRWTAGVAPERRGMRLAERDGCVLAGVLAGSLAVSEAFQYMRHPGAGMAMRRAFAISLFDPSGALDWRTKRDEPVLEIAPDNFWLIGLGNLGQAYLWTIGMLSYEQPSDVRLTMQDVDTISRANLSTSMLTRVENMGQRKTRAMSFWAERRGFATHIIERRFAKNVSIEDGDPRIALCGLDNSLGRRALTGVGFPLVLEAGLGTREKYLAFDMHVLPGSRTPAEIWSLDANDDEIENLLEKPAYQEMASQGVDRCGLITLASRSVGVPFVGTAAACVAVSMALRCAIGMRDIEQVSINLSLPDRISVFAAGGPINPLNPGYQRLRLYHAS